MDAPEILQIQDSDVYVVPRGRVVAENVPYEEYLTGKYGRHVEWIHGVVVAMMPIDIHHNDISQFLCALLDTYVHLTTGGRLLSEPMVMRASRDLPARQPDVQVLLQDRLHLLQEYEVAGAANLVVEIVSPGTEDTDRGAKFREYEKGGVPEYWILDRKRREALFYVLGDDGLYHNHLPVDGSYTSAVLPKLKLSVDILWQETPPSVPDTVKLVEEMLKE
jgi:Uma2 family endonuclease